MTAYRPQGGGDGDFVGVVGMGCRHARFLVWVLAGAGARAGVVRVEICPRVVGRGGRTRQRRPPRLFGQNQFVVLGYAQAVVFALVADQNFLMTLE